MIKILGKNAKVFLRSARIFCYTLASFLRCAHIFYIQERHIWHSVMFTLNNPIISTVNLSGRCCHLLLPKEAEDHEGYLVYPVSQGLQLNQEQARIYRKKIFFLLY